MTHPSERLAVRVAHKADAALDIAVFELVNAAGGTLPAFSAGSHIDVALPQGLVRSYSLCNDPRETHRYRIGVLKETNSRGGSRAMHEEVKVGDVLTISAPRNHFALSPVAQSSLLLAGGIGITPLWCMAQALASSAQPFALHYATRSTARMAFREEILSATFASSVQLHFDDGDPAQKLPIQALLQKPRPGVHLYTCGPKGFMDLVLSTARQYGWPQEQLHHEYFSAEPVKLASDGSFEVVLKRSGRVIPVAADQSVLAALIQQGIAVPFSCEQGVCGTCLTPVLDGVPDHRDLYLTPEEQAANDQFTPCCSRSKSARLVLDL